MPSLRYIFTLLSALSMLLLGGCEELGVEVPGDVPGPFVEPPLASELSLDAWAEVPDSSALLQGRQVIQVRWADRAKPCPDIRYRLDVLAGDGGVILAQTQLAPPERPQVLWSGYGLAISDVPVTSEPAYLRITRCCGSRCVSPVAPRSVRTFLSSSTWTDLNTEPYYTTINRQVYLGSNGRGTVWMYDPQMRRLRFAPLMGAELRLPIPGPEDTDPMGVGRAGNALWLFTNRGVFSQREGVWPGIWNEALPVVPPGSSAQRSLTKFFPRAEPEESLAGEPGPCALDTLGELLCYTGEGESPIVVHRFEGSLPRDGVVADGVAYFLLRDSRVVTLSLRGIATPGYYPTSLLLIGSQLPGGSQDSEAQVIGVHPSGTELWIGGRAGALWRVNLDDEGELQAIEGPLAWARTMDEIHGLSVDALGRLGMATIRGVGIFTSEGDALHDRSHGWHGDLGGLGWVLPGVLWSGDRFLLTAPTALPPYWHYYLMAFALSCVLAGVLGLLVVVQDSEGRQLSFIQGFVRRISADVGWGAALVALFLPQALVLAVDRLLSDLSLTPGPAGRVIPVILFLGFFMLGIHRIRSWADVTRVAGRSQLPLLVLLGAIWLIHFVLWVWPPHPRTPDFHGTLTLVHLGVALVTGSATLLFLFHTLGRMGDKREGGMG